MKRIAISQSNYIPWKGYFDLIDRVDEFVFLEDVDFTRRDWRTRNIIKTEVGLKMLSIPVKKRPRGTKIYEIETASTNRWREEHNSAIEDAYKKAKYFDSYCHLLIDIYQSAPANLLSEFNIFVIKEICKIIGIKCKFVNSKDLGIVGQKDDKLIGICKELSASNYLSGPAAKDYINPDKFNEAGVTLEYIDYSYSQYDQLHGEFDHNVSVLDLIFNCGPEALDLIRGNGDVW